MCQQIINGPAHSANVLAQKHHMQAVTLALLPKIPESTLDLLGNNVAQLYRAIPVNVENKPEPQKNIVTVVIDDPTNIDKMETVSHILRKFEVIFLITTVSDMTAALRIRYSNKLLDSRS